MIFWGSLRELFHDTVLFHDAELQDHGNMPLVTTRSY